MNVNKPLWRRNPYGGNPIWVPFSWRPSNYKEAWSRQIEKNKEKLADVHAKLISSHLAPANMPA